MESHGSRSSCNNKYCSGVGLINVCFCGVANCDSWQHMKSYYACDTLQAQGTPIFGLLP